MQVLIILAHPKPGSFAHKIAEAYREGAAFAGRSVEILDLYATPLQLGFVQPETQEEYEKNHPIRVTLQEKIAHAQEIVIIHPLWWGGPPAILKNFIDQTFTPGFAYHPAPERPLLPKRLNVVPKRLLKGRRVRLFITCDGQLWTNMVRLMPYVSTWYFYVFKFTGMRLASFHLFDYMKHRSQTSRNKWLAKINMLAQSKPVKS
jgi:NAD(P)H dehydrogenase (quinone)